MPIDPRYATRRADIIELAAREGYRLEQAQHFDRLWLDYFGAC